MKALVLSGGGARGAYEAGVVAGLQTETEFDVVCGTSIGAVNAAFVASGRTKLLREFWCDVLPKRISRALPHLSNMRHMLADFEALGGGITLKNVGSLAHMLMDMRFLGAMMAPRKQWHERGASALAEELEKVIDFAHVRNRLIVAATNITLGAPVAFHANCPQESLETPFHRIARRAEVEWRPLDAEVFARAILASAALPGLIAPIELEYDGLACNYADGGLVHNSPIGLAIDAGATEITVVFVDPVFKVTHTCPEHTVGRMACAMFVLWQQRALEYEIRLIEATNALTRAGQAPDRREIHVRYVRPEQSLAIDVLGFDDIEGIEGAFAQGIHDAGRVLEMTSV